MFVKVGIKSERRPRARRACVIYNGFTQVEAAHNTREILHRSSGDGRQSKGFKDWLNAAPETQ